MYKIIIITVIFFSLLGCSKKGCKNQSALNYDPNPKTEEDNSMCTEIKGSDNLTKTIISGVYSDVTWPKIPGAEVDYLIQGYVNIEAVLTIEPGVVVAFLDNNSGFYITDFGELNAIGTSTKPIIFKGFKGGVWKGIVIDMSYYCEIKFDYVTVQDVFVSSSTPAINANNSGNSSDIYINHSNIIGTDVSLQSCAIRFYDFVQAATRYNAANTTFVNYANQFCY